MKRIDVVFMHYHLRSGGVTSVIQRQIKSLEGLINPLLLIGETPKVPTDFPYKVIPSLAYDRDRRDNLSYKETGKRILTAVKNFYGREADLYHIHNPTLGKNRDFISIIDYLIDKKQKILLQIHDFAEDGRAENYQPLPYPSNVHYAVLNGRDYQILRKAGLSQEGLHFIPNPVELSDSLDIDNPSTKSNLILYPIRAIRRKNVGEAVLISLFLKEDDFIGVTLEPTSKIDTEKYEEWIRFSRENSLKIRFGLGLNNNFMDLVRDSKAMITTSIKEGFGMSYLEPWIFKRMLLGRKLPEICSDFSSKGIDLSYLYDKLLVPVDLVNMDIVKERIVKCYLNNLKSFGIIEEKNKIEKVVETLFFEDYIDFGLLDEENQMRTINSLIKDQSLMKRLLEINKKLNIFANFEDYNFNDLIEKNRSIIKKEYSLEKNRKLLMDIYRAVLEVKVRHSINKGILIREFNRLERMSLLLCN